MLEIKGLGKTYGAGATATHAVGEVTFSIEEGEFVCVVGPSGCGKTTLLKCIAGLLRPSAGEVLLRGSPVTSSPERMAIVFQEYSRSLMRSLLTAARPRRSIVLGSLAARLSITDGALRMTIAGRVARVSSFLAAGRAGRRSEERRVGKECRL